MRTSIYSIIGAFLLTALASCNNQEEYLVQDEGLDITAVAVGSNDNPSFSRLGYKDNQNGSVEVTWSAEDAFYLKGENGAYATMAIVEGEEGKKRAKFTGTLTESLDMDESVTAYYPAAMYDAEKNCFDVDWRMLTQDCTAGNEMNHLDDTYFMTGSGKNNEGDIEVSFVDGTKVAMIRFDLTLPEEAPSGVSIDELSIISNDLHTVGTLAVDGTFIENELLETHRQTVRLTNLTVAAIGETTFSVYVNVIPLTFNENMILKVVLSDGTVYWSEITNLKEVTLEANKRYYLIRSFMQENSVGVDYDWYIKDLDAETFVLSTEAELRGFANIVNNRAKDASISRFDFSGRKIELSNDITLHADWMPVGYNSISSSNYDDEYAFKGIFDGNGHCISNINIYYFKDDAKVTGFAGQGVGFFANILGATIQNLTVSGIVSSDFKSVGGLVGRSMYVSAYHSIVQNCKSNVEVHASYTEGHAGGLIGYARGVSVLECMNLGSVTSSGKDARIGGVIGCAYSGGSTQVKIMACYNTNANLKCLNSGGKIGGVVGYLLGSATTSQKINRLPMMACYDLVEQFSTTSYEYLGGVVGHVAYANIDACYSLAENADVIGKKESVNSAFVSNLNFPLADKNLQENADLLNAGIISWNTDLTSEDFKYCNYHYEPGTTHLVVKSGAPEASVTE